MGQTCLIRSPWGFVSPKMNFAGCHERGGGLIVLAAFLSFLLSVVLWFTDSREEALFTGLWVPSILALGGFYASMRRREP
jgi:hypothetical protein